MHQKHRSIIVLAIWLIGAAIALAVYLHCIKELWPNNPLFREELGKSYDQTFYMQSAQALATHQPGLMPRSRMPLYPWLLSFLYDGSKPQRDLIETYMRFNVTVSVLCLGAIFFMLRAVLGRWIAALLTLTLAFRVFIFKAVLVQPEILFWTMYLGLFLLMLRMLHKPSWTLAIGSGLLAGITHLTKGSSLPMIGIFTGIAFVKAALDWWHGRREYPRPSIIDVLQPVGFLAAFFAVTGVYLFNSYREYGSAFYDPNTRYYFWAESQAEMTAMQRTGLAHGKPSLDANVAQQELVRGFMEKWAPDPALRTEIMNRALAGEDVPLSGRYDILPSYPHWKETHTWRDAVERVWSGLFGDENDDRKPKERKVERHPVLKALLAPFNATRNSLVGHNRDHPNGYWDMLQLLLWSAFITFAAALAFSSHHVWRDLKKDWPRVAFILASLIIPALSYAWWGQISNRNRYFLTLYLPLLLSLSLLIKYACLRIPLRVRLPWRGRDLVVEAWTLVMLTATIYLALDLRDPLNRRNQRDPNDLVRQIVQ